MAVLKLYPLDLDARQQCGGATYVRTGSQAESPFRSAGTLERVRADYTRGDVQFPSIECVPFTHTIHGNFCQTTSKTRTRKNVRNSWYYSPKLELELELSVQKFSTWNERTKEMYRRAHHVVQIIIVVGPGLQDVCRRSSPL